MPIDKSLPVSVRYLKARLTILKRPTVWLSGSMLMVALLLLVEHWQYPQHRAKPLDDGPMEAEANQPEPSALAPLDPYASVDELSFGDTTPPLAATDSAAQLSFLSTASNALDTPADLESLLLNPLFASTLARGRTTSSSQANFVTPKWDDRSAAPDALGATQSVFVTTEPVEQTEGDAITSERTNQPGPNPLQAAIDRHQSPDGSLSTNSEPLSSLSNPSLNPIASIADDRAEPAAAPFSFPQPANSVQPQPLPGQPSWLQTHPQPQFLPQTSPLPGTTGYTLPPALRTSTSLESIDTPTKEYHQGYRQPTVQPVQPALPTSNATPEQPAPFSIPRAVPGRSIGNGEINTFSNP
jgi:hypothetical protein